MNILPFVSVIIPCRNEEKFIGKCIESVIMQDFPKENIEVLVIDGMSDDRTRDIIAEYAKQSSFIRQLENPKKIVPTAMNIGILKSKGEIVIRMDAHTIYEKDYISKCIKNMREYDTDNVGGILMTLPANNTSFAQAIAFALSHPFGVGNSYFRIGSKEPRYVDTVPFGCYKREVFYKIGLFDEDLVRNQDDEFNLRLIRNGGKILLAPDIISYYYARDSLSKLWKMYYQYGYFKPIVTKKIGAVLTWRQLIPSFFVTSTIGSFILSYVYKPFMLLLIPILCLYFVINLTFSFHIAVKKGLKYIMTLPVVFLTLHLSYGVGYLKGMWDITISHKNDHRKFKNIPMTR